MLDLFLSLKDWEKTISIELSIDKNNYASQRTNDHQGV